MKYMFLVTIALYFSSSLGYRFLEDEEQPDAFYFPPEYRVTGEEISMDSNIITPFEAWYSSEYNKSRIDYFGGMVKRFFYGGGDNFFGTAYEIHPETTEKVTNEMLCYQQARIGPQDDFLPETSDYEFVDDEDLNGQDTEKWVKIYEDEGDYMKIEETLWVHSLGENRQAIPVRYEMKRYNSWFGEMEAHVIENYFDFESSVDNEDLDVENYACEYKNVEEVDIDSLAFVDPHDDEHISAVFNQYLTRHSRQYANKREHLMRKSIFRRNLQKILTTNHKKLGYTLALNKFADRTKEELRHLTTLKPSSPDAVGNIPFPYTEADIEKSIDGIPDDYDMRMEGLISPVKDQSSCGSCWAFTMAATIEGALARNNGGRVIRLSEQAFVDCAWGYSAAGCEGGYIDRSFQFALKHGVVSDEDYGPYLAMDGYCHINNVTNVQTISGFTKVTPLSENALKVAIYNHGPVAVAMYASYDLVLYSGGVFYDLSCDEPRTYINHAVTVVGYGQKDGDTFWIVKNSWGQDWGSAGYVLFSAKNDNCLLETEPFYAVA